MCLGTKIKKISGFASAIMIIIALVTSIVSYVGGKAIADDRIVTLREERIPNANNEFSSIKKCIEDMKYDVSTIQKDMAVTKNDMAWIKGTLETHYGK